MTENPKRDDDVLQEMRREVERAAKALRTAANKAMERPETKKLLSKADGFLGKLGRGTDVLIHELEKDFKDLATKLREATKGDPKNEDTHGSSSAEPGPDAAKAEEPKAEGPKP